MTNRLVVYRRGHTPQSLHSHIYMFSECLLGCSQMWSHPSVDCISTADLFSAGKNTYTGSYDRSKDSTGNAWCFVGQWYFTRYYNTHQSRAALIAALAWIMWLLCMQRWRHSVCIFVHRILFVHNPASSGYNLLLNRNTRDQTCIWKRYLAGSCCKPSYIYNIRACMTIC